MLASHGAMVAAVSRKEPPLSALAAEWPDNVRACPADVTQPGSVSRVFEEVRNDWGPVTLLVAAAGVAVFGDTLGMPDEVWDSAVATNLTGLYTCNLNAIRHMLEAGGGDIVNVLSIAADMGIPQAAAYCASKAGALGLTRSLNAEYRVRGIRVSALIPGATDTPLWNGSGSTIDPGRMMKADDVAEAIVWMASRSESVSVDAMHIMPREGFL